MAYHHHQQANLNCILKVHPRCDACKRQAVEVLRSIDGVYDVTIDSEARTARICGEVDPRYCIRALARCGIHAELLHANITSHHHPTLPSDHIIGTRAGPYRRNFDHDYLLPSYYDHGHDNHNYYGGYRRSLPEGMWHSLPEYSYNPDYYYGRGRGRPSYVRYIDDGPVNSCSIF